VRVAVDGGGFVVAGTAARTANQVAALHYDSLSGKLDGFRAMAGNDATSIDFARSYDAASAEALDALDDLSAAFIGLGRLIHATDANHRRAEDASAGLTVSAYSGRDLHEDDYVRVVHSSPPSRLGAQEPGFGEVETWILDRIEGFVWPGADVGRLRDAASAWRNAATGVDDLVDSASAPASSSVVRPPPRSRSHSTPSTTCSGVCAGSATGSASWRACARSTPPASRPHTSGRAPCSPRSHR
jgi:hypothetical protein